MEVTRQCACAVVFLGLISLGWAARRISTDDRDYLELKALCPTNSNKTVNVLTKNDCDLRTFVMCFRGYPLFMAQCPGVAPRFNVKTGYCDYVENVPLSSRCDPRQSDSSPKTCDMGAITVPDNSTCKVYWVCTGERPERMPCNKHAYFIDGRCQFDIYPFRELINQEELKRCRNLDIWKDDINQSGIP